MKRKIATPDKRTDADFARQALAYRKKNFAVECGQSKDNPGEIRLSVTFNGFQWQVETYLPHESKAIVKALQDAIKAMK